MVSRREILGGAGLAALSLGLRPVQASAAGLAGLSKRPALFLADSAIAGEVARAALRAGVPTLHYSGDIGMPWLEQLEPMWRERPCSVAGVTFGGAFFCLEQLARAHGMACTLKFEPPWARSGQLVGLEAATVSATLFGSSGGQKLESQTAAYAADRPLAWLLEPAAYSRAKE